MNGQALALSAAIDDPEDAMDDPVCRVGTLFDAHRDRIYRLARRLTRTHDDACDAVQETFLRAARSPRRIPLGAASEEAWLVRVLINICRDRWRHAAVRAKAAPPPSLSAPPADPEASAVARATVWRALDALPPRRRAVLVMYELEGSTIPSIAKLLGVTAVTVRWHLSVGRREMARILGGQP